MTDWMTLYYIIGALSWTGLAGKLAISGITGDSRADDIFLWIGITCVSVAWPIVPASIVIVHGWRFIYTVRKSWTSA